MCVRGRPPPRFSLAAAAGASINRRVNTGGDDDAQKARQVTVRGSDGDANEEERGEEQEKEEGNARMFGHPFRRQQKEHGTYGGATAAAVIRRGAGLSSDLADRALLPDRQHRFPPLTRLASSRASSAAHGFHDAAGSREGERESESEVGGGSKSITSTGADREEDEARGRNNGVGGGCKGKTSVGTENPNSSRPTGGTGSMGDIGTGGTGDDEVNEGSAATAVRGRHARVQDGRASGDPARKRTKRGRRGGGVGIHTSRNGGGAGASGRGGGVSLTVHPGGAGARSRSNDSGDRFPPVPGAKTHARQTAKEVEERKPGVPSLLPGPLRSNRHAEGNLQPKSSGGGGRGISIITFGDGADSDGAEGHRRSVGEVDDGTGTKKKRRRKLAAGGGAWAAGDKEATSRRVSPTPARDDRLLDGEEKEKEEEKK